MPTGVVEVSARLCLRPPAFAGLDRSGNRNERRVVSGPDGQAVVLSVVGFNHADGLYWKMFVKFWFSNFHCDGVLVEVMDSNRV
ncbi:hypothetical protein NDU88_005975 [Pleurodeles waltl]|uniref:Uncharacterized protein n=1 Tax=Pleurodeles waltl TaxID=8319 RepID=A0AAV7QGM8_PLEWA|nr:hypothetical protein NDU88_005975 [Pleurodeles waltl]